ncbi:hypothetical protein N9J72_01210 [Candidatus Gracilibacteria bacterium]|nr:hypothetical protein [Candidatus Gracilibacteria bacterium]
MDVITQPSLIRDVTHASLEDFLSFYNIEIKDLRTNKGYIYTLSNTPIGQIQEDGVVVFEKYRDKEKCFQAVTTAESSEDVQSIISEGDKTISLPEGFHLGVVRERSNKRGFYIDFGGVPENMLLPQERINECEFDIVDGMELVFDFTLTSGFPEILTLAEAKQLVN